MEHQSQSPTVYVVAGPNGAGKTTFSTRYLHEFEGCQEFLNADLIAAGLSPFQSSLQDLRAGRLLLDRIEELVSDHVSFGFETTLSGRSYLRLLKEVKQRGYRIVIHFLWLPTVEMAISRVANRVQQGGHDIPQDAIRRRFCRGLRNFDQSYSKLADFWIVYDSSNLSFSLIAKGCSNQIEVIHEAIFDQYQLSLN